MNTVRWTTKVVNRISTVGQNFLLETIRMAPLEQRYCCSYEHPKKMLTDDNALAAAGDDAWDSILAFISKRGSLWKEVLSTFSLNIGAFQSGSSNKSASDLVPMFKNVVVFLSAQIERQIIEKIFKSCSFGQVNSAWTACSTWAPYYGVHRSTLVSFLGLQCNYWLHTYFDEKAVDFQVRSVWSG